MKRLFLVLLLATATLAGCKKKSADKGTEPASANKGSAPGGTDAGSAPVGRDAGMSPAQLEETMNRLLTLMSTLGDVVDANQNDCARMAAAVEQVLAADAAFLAEARRYKRDPAAQKMIEGWMKIHGDKMLAVAGKMAAGQRKCGADPAVRKAFAALEM